MKFKYIVVTWDALQKLRRCFAGTDEVKTFVENVRDLQDELVYTSCLMKRVNAEDAVLMMLKTVCCLSVFYREHAELFQQLVKNLDMDQIKIVEVIEEEPDDDED